MTAILPAKYNQNYYFQNELFHSPTAHLPEWVRNTRKLNDTCAALIEKGWGLRVVNDQVRCTHTRDSGCRDVPLKKAVQMQALFDELDGAA